MGAQCEKLFAFYLCYLLICVQSRPIKERENDTSDQDVIPGASYEWSVLLAVTFSISCILVLLGCLNCCKQRAGFKEFRNSTSESNVNSVGLDFVNPLQNVINTQPSRYSIFSSIAEASGDQRADSVVTFEPLPKVLPSKFSSLRSQQFNGNSYDVGFIEDWLGDEDFPRQQLHYLRECGQGWFGKVVEGEARGILPSSNKVYRVVVRILKEDASAAEQAFFLQEAKPFKDLSHPNVLKLLGRCLENVPFLLVFESCSNGDLKRYLKQNVGNKDALIYQGILLRMAVDVACGLSYMLQNGFVHTDIAARNCLVTGDLRIKIGDYGANIQTYKEEYYFNGDIALPIRWCAPETINCTETTIEPKQVTGASCIWSYGVLLWELEEWGELPYKDLSDDQVINRVFGVEGLRLSCPVNRTPYTQEMYHIMKDCWRDYVDRPSFIHVMNSVSAVLHRFKNNDFDARWHSSKPNSIPVIDNEDRVRIRIASLSGKGDSDSGIDLHNPKSKAGLSMSQVQQLSSKQRLPNDDYSSESSVSSRRFSNSSTGDLFSSPISIKMRSPSLENLHGSLDNLGSFNRRISGDEVFDRSSGFSWSRDQGSMRPFYSTSKVDFRLGFMSNNDASILWNNKPLFQSDNYLEDNSITRRVDSLSTDAEEEVWRKRIERGEFTEKVKEKSKSVADLMILTHIDCSESSESDSLPSFHSRQSSFNRHCRRASKSNAPVSLLNSLSFGSESNLPVVEKDQEFQETLKKIQIAKINGDEDSLNLISLQTNSLVICKDEKDGKINHFLANENLMKAGKIGHFLGNETSVKNNQMSNFLANEASTKDIETNHFLNAALKKTNETGHFLANEASEKRSLSSHINCTSCSIDGCSKEKLPLPLINSNLFEKTILKHVNDVNNHISISNKVDESEVTLKSEAPVSENYANETDERFSEVNRTCVQETREQKESNLTCLFPFLPLKEEPISTTCDLSSLPLSTNEEEIYSSSCNSENVNSVVLGPSENHTLDFFKGLKTTLVDEKSELLKTSSDQLSESTRPLNEFINATEEDYFYKCVGDSFGRNRDQLENQNFRSQFCDFCYAKCHFSSECLRCKDKSLDENCSCESFENLEKIRDCTTLNSCPFQSDDSGRGTDQINSGDGSSDKSLESSISLQMNEVKNRLEDVIAKFTGMDDLSDDNCSSLEDDCDTKYLGNIRKEPCSNFPVQVYPHARKCKTADPLTIEESVSDEVADCIQKDEECVAVEELAILEKIELEPIGNDLHAENIVDCENINYSEKNILILVSEENENSASIDENTCIGIGLGSPSSNNCSEEGSLEVDLISKDDKSNSSSQTFVKVEQLFFTVDPKFSQDIETELSKSYDSSLKKCSSIGEIDNKNITPDEAGEIEITEIEDLESSIQKKFESQNNIMDNTCVLISSLQDDSETFVSSETEIEPVIIEPDDENDNTCGSEVVYEISDIIEGLAEPISLPYSVNQPTNEISDGRSPLSTSSDVDHIPEITNNWLPSPIDDEYDNQCKRSLEIDEVFAEAIRNELREKLPNSSSLTTVELEETNNDNAHITIEYYTCPTQLSPIFEEEEYMSSSSVQSVLSSDSESSGTINGSSDYTYEVEDILMVNADTNEASMLDCQKSSFLSPSFDKLHKLNETYEIDENEDTVNISDHLDSDSLLTPESLSPGTSSKTGAQFSCSSSECGNLSDVFLSPSSSKNFDELDVDKSPDNGRLLNTPENSYQKVILNIDEMLKRSEPCIDSIKLGNSLLQFEENKELVNSNIVRHNRDKIWLQSYFTPCNEIMSLTNFDNDPSAGTEFRSLPADFRSDSWPPIDELVQPKECLVKNTETYLLEVDDDGIQIDTNLPDRETLQNCASEKIKGISKMNDELKVNNSLTTEETQNSDEEADDGSKLKVVAESRTIELQQPEKAETVYVSESEASSSENSWCGSQKGNYKEEDIRATPSTDSSPSSTKLKNSIALFGNSNKQIRNFRVSVVEDDTYVCKPKLSPNNMKTVDSYWTEKLGILDSFKGSQETWKSPFNSFLHDQNSRMVDAKDTIDMMSTSFIESDSQNGSIDGKDDHLVKSNDSDDDGMESTSDEFIWKENDSVIEIAQNKNKKTDSEEDNDDDDDDEDDDDEELADFVPFSWNSDALPSRSALKAKNKVTANKKNVSFKKQKYHCVYEYPKEEPNYTRIYDNILQERMLNLWNMDRDFLYGDYSSFADWELDDCDDEQQACNDDILTFNGNVPSASRSNLSNKLGFYTIGTYSLDNGTKTENEFSNSCNSGFESSSVVTYPTENLITPSSATNAETQFADQNDILGSENASSVICTNDTENVDTTYQDKCRTCDNVKENDPPSSSLGELRHTKNRLKLDLNSAVTSYKSVQSHDKPLIEKHDSGDADMVKGISQNDTLNDAGSFVSDYGLNYKSCDISPVVELKSLASTSVA